MLSGFVAEYGRRSTPYLTVLTFEETCEIVGLLIGVGALLRLLSMVQPRTMIELFDAGGGTIGIAPGSSSATAPGPKAEQLP